MRNHKKNRVERYDLERSPFAQRPTQREIAGLLGESRDDLRRLVNYKEQFIVQRTETSGKKVRNLAYPISRLRAVHERMKFHLNKVKQPSYLFSPRKNKSQADNAEKHLDKQQYLTLDIKQFYPSTTYSMIKNFFEYEMAVYKDVAGLLAHAFSIDGRASFGSPLTPVLCTLVHRDMFDGIAAACDGRRFNYSVWVDDITISGRFIPGEFVQEIRGLVSDKGLKSHKIVYRTGNRPVFITGIGVVGRNLIAPNNMHLRIRDLWKQAHEAETVEEKEACITRLLSELGTLRRIAGRSAKVGRKAAEQMHSLRQKLAKLRRQRATSRPEVADSDTLPVAEEDRPF